MDAAELHRLSATALREKAGGRLTVLPDADAVHRHFAREIAREIAANNQAGRPTRLILPVGPTKQYPPLVDICNADQLTWRDVHAFFMDEYCDWQARPLPRSHPLSLEGTARSLLLTRLAPALRPPEVQVHFPRPSRLDELAEAIDQAGGIDTCYGGIGIHGHVAFNEPPVAALWRVDAATFLDSGPRIVALNPETVTMNAARSWGGDVVDFPPFAVTLGMRQVRLARRIRLYCPSGGWQRIAVRRALLGEPQVDYPVSLLREHPDFLIIADEDTAAPLAGPASALKAP